MKYKDFNFSSLRCIYHSIFSLLFVCLKLNLISINIISVKLVYLLKAAKCIVSPVILEILPASTTPNLSLILIYISMEKGKL